MADNSGVWVKIWPDSNIGNLMGTYAKVNGDQTEFISTVEVTE